MPSLTTTWITINNYAQAQPTDPRVGGRWFCELQFIEQTRSFHFQSHMQDEPGRARCCVSHSQSLHQSWNLSLARGRKQRSRSKELEGKGLQELGASLSGMKGEMAGCSVEVQ